MTTSEYTTRRGVTFTAAAFAILALLLLSPATARAQWTTSGTNISNTNTGNVGVGTGASAPTGKIEVRQIGNSGLLATLLTSFGANEDTFLRGGSSTATVHIGDLTATTSRLLLMENGGNVGIGTASPGVMPKVGRVILTVKGISDAGVLELATGSADADGSDVGHIQFVDVNNPNTEKRIARIVTQLSGVTANNRAGIMRFDLKADGGGSIVSRMHLSANGLHLAGNASTSAVNRLDVNGNAAIGSTYALTAAPADGLIVQGSVGIGATSPLYKLDVAGQIRSRTGGFVFPDGTTQATAASPVTFGSTAGTAVQGNTALTVAAGAGMSGGGTATLGGGGTLTLTNSDRGSSQNIFKNVGNAAGATQFSAGSNADTLRFEGTGGTVVSFDAANRKVVINSSAPSSGWTDDGSSVSLTNTAAKLGVGTNGPDKLLTVQGQIAAPLGVLSVIRTTGANNGYGLSLDATGTGNNNLGFMINGTPKASMTWDVTNNYLGFVNMAFAQNYFSLRLNSDGSLAYNDSAGGAERFRVTAAGNVGIGTATPLQRLQIGGSTVAGTTAPDAISLGATYSTAAGQNPKLRLWDTGNPAQAYGLGVSSAQLDFMIPTGARYVWNVNGAEKMRLDESGNVTVTGNISAKYQDVAEWVPSVQKLSPGTVVVLDTERTNHVVASGRAYDTGVAGVVSAEPGVILGVGGDDKVKVATTGRVRIKVDATHSPIKIGDLLVTSDVEGVAMKSEPMEIGGRKMHAPGTIVGKALEPLEKGTGEILVLLSLQ